MANIAETYLKCVDDFQSKGIQNFDPKINYKLQDLDPRVSPRVHRLQMGKIATLITDMAEKGATEDELIRAVRHSIVVIDSVKHHLDYKKSYEDNGIAELEAKYSRNKQAL